MKAAEVLRLLKVTRPTLSKYVKENIIRTEVMPNGHYNYNDVDVYKFLNGGQSRKTVIYAKAFGRNKKAEIDDQVNTLSQFCFNRGYSVNAIYKDTTANSKEGLNDLLDAVIEGSIERIVITNPMIISKTDFDFIEQILKRYNTEIVYMQGIIPSTYTADSLYTELCEVFKNYSDKLCTKSNLRLLRTIVDTAMDDE